MKSLFKNPEKVFLQTVAAFSASLSFLLIGTVRAYSSPAMPSMNATFGDQFNVDDYALFASLPPTGSLTAALLVGPILNYIGRRWTIIATSVPWAASFLMIGLSAGNKSLIFTGRVIMGAMIGFAAPSTQIYIAECASPTIRGTLGSLTALMLAFGIVITYAIGALVEWDLLALILSGLPVLLFVLMLAMPESPVWLLTNHREEEARKSLQRLRGKATDITEEFEKLRQSTTMSSRTDGKETSFHISDVFKPRALKPLGVSVALMLFQQASGINVIIYFTVSIFRASGSTINNYIATLIVGIVQLVCTVPAVFLVDRYGRRILLILSGTFMAIALFCMGAYFYFLEATDTELDGFGWIPLASLILFVVAYSGGYSNVPYLVMSELFPINLRNLFGSLSTCANLSCLFLMLYTFPILAVSVGHFTAFWLYASFNTIGVFFVHFFLPETKGKTLQEIERYFTKESNKTDGNRELDVKYTKASSLLDLDVRSLQVI